MTARLGGLLLLSFLLVGAAAPAAAQESQPATVSHVVDGDTVDAQLMDGSVVRVRLIGIDTPEVGACGADRATAALEQLVLGRAVTLMPDPTQGVHARCGGDFSRSREDELLERRLSAVAFMRRYYARVSSRRFAAAWGMLGRPVRRDLGSFGAWRSGYRRSLGASVSSARARLSGGRAVISVRVLSRDRDACSRRVVRQHFSGRWVLAPRRQSWVAVRTRMRKTGGGRVRLTRAECRPAPRPPAPAPPEPPRPPQDCQGYDPCLPPGPDVDCAGGSGNGPSYVNGPVHVSGDDPYGLDGDGDGVACES